MSSLKMLERDCIEGLFGMGSGYVMDFSNRTFAEFLRESSRVDIYSDKYANQGDSKAKRLRAFIEVEPDALVGKVLSDLLEYWRFRTPQPNPKNRRSANRPDKSLNVCSASPCSQTILGRIFSRRILVLYRFREFPRPVRLHPYLSRG